MDAAFGEREVDAPSARIRERALRARLGKRAAREMAIADRRGGDREGTSNEEGSFGLLGGG